MLVAGPEAVDLYAVHDLVKPGPGGGGHLIGHGLEPICPGGLLLGDPPEPGGDPQILAGGALSAEPAIELCGVPAQDLAGGGGQRVEDDARGEGGLRLGIGAHHVAEQLGVIDEVADLSGDHRLQRRLGLGGGLAKDPGDVAEAVAPAVGRIGGHAQAAILVLPVAPLVAGAEHPVPDDAGAGGILAAQGLDEIEIVGSGLDGHRQVQRHGDVEGQPPRGLGEVPQPPGRRLGLHKVEHVAEVGVPVHRGWALQVVEHQRVDLHPEVVRGEARQLKERLRVIVGQRGVGAVVGGVEIHAGVLGGHVVGDEGQRVDDPEIDVPGGLRELALVEGEAEGVGLGHRGHLRLDALDQLLLHRPGICGVEAGVAPLLGGPEVHPGGLREAPHVAVVGEGGPRLAPEPVAGEVAHLPVDVAPHLVEVLKPITPDRIAQLQRVSEVQADAAVLKPRGVGPLDRRLAPGRGLGHVDLLRVEEAHPEIMEPRVGGVLLAEAAPT